jgi:MFS family permease
MRQLAESGAGKTGRARSLTARSALGFIVLLGVVSLFADMTYEGGRSLVGQYLGLLGASAAAIAVTAGAGEFLGYALRFVSGWAADRTKRYWAITVFGYVFQLFALPALALAGRWQLAIMLVFMERIGKAIRNPSRDAMLAYATTQTGRGFGYGLHEALDQIGAVLGPVLLSLILYFKSRAQGAAGGLAGYRVGFLVLLAPACLAVLSLFIARFLFPRPADFELPDKSPRLAARGYSRAYWIYLAAAALMAAGITDFPLIAFHFQRISLVPEYWLPTMFALAMAVDAGSALLFGVLYDRIGFPILIVMFAVEAATAPFLFLGRLPGAIAGMALWGISMGTQESIMRAAVADLIPAERRATGFGLFHMAFGVAWFAGSALMGILYQRDVRALVAFAVAIQVLAIPLAVLANSARLKTQRPKS